VPIPRGKSDTFPVNLPRVQQGNAESPFFDTLEIRANQLKYSVFADHLAKVEAEKWQDGPGIFVTAALIRRSRRRSYCGQDEDQMNRRDFVRLGCATVIAAGKLRVQSRRGAERTRPPL
jgi:hypothetical protein